MPFSAQARSNPADAWTAEAAVRCRSDAGAVIGVLECPTRGRADADLRRQFRVLQGAYEGRGMAMAVAGHDLRQPLQVIGMVLARLAARTGDARDLSWLDIANGEIARLAAGLDHLAVLSRDEDCADGAPATGEIRVDDVLRDAVHVWRHHAQAKGLRLTFVPSGMTVRSHPRLLSVIVGNLVSNAIKYTDHGGVVVGCRRRGAGAAIEVVDTGRGFSEQSERVFSPFWREDNDAAGLGLGLSIVQRTAALLGHGVSVRSRRGAGSRVGVTLGRASTV